MALPPPSKDLLYLPQPAATPPNTAPCGCPTATPCSARTPLPPDLNQPQGGTPKGPRSPLQGPFQLWKVCRALECFPQFPQGQLFCWRVPPLHTHPEVSWVPSRLPAQGSPPAAVVSSDQTRNSSFPMLHIRLVTLRGTSFFPPLLPLRSFQPVTAQSRMGSCGWAGAWERARLQRRGDGEPPRRAQGRTVYSPSGVLYLFLLFVE